MGPWPPGQMRRGVCGAVVAAPGRVVLDLGGLDQFEIDEANLPVPARRLEELDRMRRLPAAHGGGR